MSLHRSLKMDRMKKQKNVLTRTERIKKLIEEKKWDGKQVTGLPKVKIIKIKTIKKEKIEKKEEGLSNYGAK